MFRKVLLAFTGLLSLTAFSQNVQFQVFSLTGGPICTYAIRNSGDVEAKLISVSMRVFHQRPNLDFRGISATPGFSKYQYSGKFKGANKSFNYKTVCIFPQDSLIQPASQLGLMEITNYNVNFKDSIMAAGITVFCKVNGRDTTVEAYPGGATPCPGKHIFLNGGSASSGLKEGGFGFINLAQGSCENTLNAIIYDGNTLKRKAVAGRTPLCANGRKWTTFGFNTDSFVYYSFDITTSAGRKQLDSLTAAMNNNDYMALGNLKIISLSWFDSCRNALQRIGFSNNRLPDTTGYLVLAGRKGLSTGAARMEFCASPHLNCYTSLEQTMLATETGNTMSDFGGCFEASEIIVEKGWPLNQKTTQINNFRIYPNPSQDQWTISGPDITEIVLYSASGKAIENGSAQPNGAFTIGSAQLPAGVYMATIKTSGSGQTSVRLIRY